MSYKIIEPEKFNLGHEVGKRKKKIEYREYQALVTFEYGHTEIDHKPFCCKAHIHEDDHCYLVAISDGHGGYHDTTYIFPEALAVLKTLPDPWDKWK